MVVRGPEGFKQLVTVIRAALPDLIFTIDDMVAEGDAVAYRFTMRGTFKGPLMGIAPTGKQINFKEAHFIRFSGGKEVEALAFGDMVAWYQQLGIPIPTG
jgi:predicted ester cyclase